MTVKIAGEGSKKKKKGMRIVGLLEVMGMEKKEQNEKHDIMGYTCQQTNGIRTNL